MGFNTSELLDRKKYLIGCVLVHRSWRESRPAWDHDHCEFCWATFTDDLRASNALREGYCTLDEYHWICDSCVEELKGAFQWSITTEERVPDLAELREQFGIPDQRSPGRKLGRNNLSGGQT